MARPWTDKDIARLLELEANGENGMALSTHQIAKAMHRNALCVATKLHDHGRRIGKPTSNHHSGPQSRPIFDHVPIGSEPDSCRWVEGDPRRASYCPNAKKAGSDFCPDHHSIVHLPPMEIRSMDALVKWVTA